MAAAMKNVFSNNTALHVIRSHLVGTTRVAACSATNKNVRFMSMTSDELTRSAKGAKISHAMKIYITRLQKHEEFVQEATADYELGKRHLANIMGEDPDTFTQEDIDKAIQYLLPSSLKSSAARPQMKHPDDFIPKTFVSQFDVHGRPLHSMYYTCKPEFHKIMFDAAIVLERLKKLDDHNVMNKGPDPPTLFIIDSSWLGRDKIAKMIGEKVTEIDYEKLMKLLDRIVHEPQAATEKDFIMRFRERRGQQIQIVEEEIPLQIDEDGRHYQDAEGTRKSATAKVRVYMAGKGKVTVNGEDLIDYFPRTLDRQQILFPLHFVGMLGKLDVVAEVSAGGASGQAGALRYALSLALLSFTDFETRTKMRLAGLVTRDVRRKERKKFGQERARKKFTWKKR